MKIESIQNLIGGTPLVFLEKYKGAEIWVKLEGNNLSGSLKDRTAQRLLNEMEKRGDLSLKKKVIAPSSGSFAVSVAMQAVLRGYPAALVVNSKISGGNLKILEKLDVEIIRHGNVSRESMEYCEELINEHPEKYSYADQLNDPAAVAAHYDTTAKEIIEDMPDVSAIVASMGSGATLLGISTFMRDNKHAVDMFASIGIIGDRKKITGTYSPGTDYETPFIKKLHNENLIKDELEVLYDTSKQRSKELFQKGLIVGPQTGGVYDATMQAISKYDLQGKIVLISGDTGLKWL